MNQESRMRTMMQDDFGQEFGFIDLSSKAIDAMICFAIDGMNEGIHAGILQGDIDEDCLMHWGLIA